MRLLPEEERLETLAILSKNKQEVERALQVGYRWRTLVLAQM